MNSPAPPESIDAVYTWVDGADPAWRRQMNRSLARMDPGDEALDADSRRYRNNDELRYSLRSLNEFAPWIRRVYLVTSGQTPDWLHTASPRLRIVPHEDIFPGADCLPTFNSHAIELNLHRIPGLSRRFLYLNDDLFLGRACNRSDFLEADTGMVYFERIGLEDELQPGQVTDRACARTRNRVAAAFKTDRLTWMPAHTPQLYDRRLLAELEARFADDFASTSARRFRSAQDLVLRIAYATLANARGQQQRVLDWGSVDYAFLSLRGNPVSRLRDLAFIRRLKPRFFCLNDDGLSGWNSAALACLTRYFLERCFPEPSAFEKEGADA